MIKISTAQLWVHDQDEALDFYTKKLGMEVRSDVTLAELGDFRWLTVAPPGQEDVAIVLMAIPGPPVMDSETAGDVRNLMAKGFAGTVFLTTDTCRPRSRSSRAAARVRRGARGAAVRNRLGVPRPVRQQLPPHAGAGHGCRLSCRRGRSLERVSVVGDEAPGLLADQVA